MEVTTESKKSEIKETLNDTFLDFFKPVEAQHKQLRYKMFLKKAECFSTKRKFKNYSLQDSELCSNKAGWPSYKLQLDISELNKNCSGLLEYEDFKCQELAKTEEKSAASLFGFGKKEGEPVEVKNLSEVNQCLDSMVGKYRECLAKNSVKLNDLYDTSLKNYEGLIASAPKEYGYKKEF